MFIRAERLGDWNLHLISLQRMLNIFAATGHNNYAKSARLYLETMQDLPKTNPWLFDLFAVHGYHVVRRSDRQWAGLWTDLVIEQTMMRSLKTRGGLTHGSGMTESVRMNWVKTMHKCASVHDAMCSLSGLEKATREEHIELGKSRSNRDGKDLRKILQWFDVHDPFKSIDSELRSLSSGLMATAGDGINCDMAEEIGAKIHAKMDDKCFTDVVLKKSDQIKTLVRLQKGLAIEKKEVFLQTTHLFNRLIVLVERTADMEPYFSYELTPLPASLFKDSFMRKPDKAALGQILCKNAKQLGDIPTCTFVVDGGSLLHKIKWPKIGKYVDVIKLYLSYVQKHYGTRCIVVFDGYASGPSVKDHEHDRRAKTSTSAPNIMVNEQNPVYSKQNPFLANGHNKTEFIAILSKYLIADNHQVIQAVNDADTEIVKVAIELASTGAIVTVAAEDTDVLVLLIYHFQSSFGEIFMLSSQGTKKPSRLVNIREIQKDIGISAVQQLLVIHSVSGCDTTSALFGLGKVSIFRKMSGNKLSTRLTEVLSSSTASQMEVADAGCQLLVMLYGGKPGQKLDSLRHMFIKTTA
jgi:hypothetical protein